MDIKKNNVPNNTVTRKLTDIDAQTGNIYTNPSWSYRAAPTR